jgi:hypothetical protein
MSANMSGNLRSAALRCVHVVIIIPYCYLEGNKILNITLYNIKILTNS